MKVQLADNKVMIIIDPEDIKKKGDELGVDMTDSEASEILERLFIGDHKDEDFEPMVEDMINSAVCYETGTSDINWDDLEERQCEIDRKVLVYKGLVYNYKLNKFEKR